MPRCVLGEHCSNPTHDLRPGHACQRCHQLVHVLCGEEDPSSDAANNVICFLCTIPPKFPKPNRHHPHLSKAYAIETNQPPLRTLADQPPKNNSLTSKQKSSQSTRTQKIQSHRKARKTTTAKEFRLDADQSKPDPLLMKPVAFDVDNNIKGNELYEHFGGDDEAKRYLTIRNGKRMLLGTIIRASKKTKGAKQTSSILHYDVQWEESDLGQTAVDVSLVIDAIALYRTIFSSQNVQRSSSRKPRNRDPFSPDLRTLLFSVDDNEKGKPESSDDEGTNSDQQELDDFLFRPHTIPANVSRCMSISEDNDDSDDFGVTSDFCWATGLTLRSPPDRSSRPPSHVVPALAGNFATPIQSFLAFIPLKIFNSIAIFSNNYAHHVMETSENRNVSGRKWETDISINEIMKFFGILFKMVLRPTPGQSYPFCWNDPQWHPYTRYMPLRRFQQIRAVLHFNDNSNIEASDDAAFKVSAIGLPISQTLFTYSKPYGLFIFGKVRPLLNCVKNTFPQYLALGDEVSLDEASVSCRSRYGGDVIFYNPRKPGGKFHFRFYMLCCSTSYACVRLRMHTRNKTDVADAPTSPSAVMRARLGKKGSSREQPNPTIAGTKATRLFADENGIKPKKAGLKTTGLSDDETSMDEEDAGESSEPKKTSGVMLTLIMDMCEPLFGSGRIVNMDNYYTSPMVAWMLAQEKVYLRGTCRTNRIGFPSGVSFNSKEKKNWGRGTIRAMIEKKKKNRSLFYPTEGGLPSTRPGRSEESAECTLFASLGADVESGVKSRILH